MVGEYLVAADYVAGLDRWLSGAKTVRKLFPRKVVRLCSCGVADIAHRRIELDERRVNALNPAIAALVIV